MKHIHVPSSTVQVFTDTKKETMVDETDGG